MYIKHYLIIMTKEKSKWLFLIRKYNLAYTNFTVCLKYLCLSKTVNFFKLLLICDHTIGSCCVRILHIQKMSKMTFRCLYFKLSKSVESSNKIHTSYTILHETFLYLAKKVFQICSQACFWHIWAIPGTLKFFV